MQDNIEIFALIRIENGFRSIFYLGDYDFIMSKLKEIGDTVNAPIYPFMVGRGGYVQDPHYRNKCWNAEFIGKFNSATDYSI